MIGTSESMYRRWVFTKTTVNREDEERYSYCGEREVVVVPEDVMDGYYKKGEAFTLNQK